MLAPSSRKLGFAHTALRRAIFSGEFKINDKLPTEAELAQRFNCSVGTASRALSLLAHEGLVERKARWGTRVISSKESAPAGRLDACAYIYPNDKHEGIWRILRGFQNAAQKAERKTLLIPVGEDSRKEAEVVGRLSEFDVKGAVLYPIILGPKDQGYYTQMILACPFPVVLVDVNLPGLGCPAVIPDGFDTGYVVTKYLLNKGLRRIGFCANNAWVQSVRDRLLGYRKAMEEANLGGETIVHLDHWMTPNYQDFHLEPKRVATEFLQKHPDAEGVVCASDFLGKSCLEAARELNIDVPNSLKIVGIDDYQMDSETDASLTTYRVSYEKIGQLAFETLEKLLRGEKPDSMEIQVRGEIVRRKSA